MYLPQASMSITLKKHSLLKTPLWYTLFSGIKITIGKIMLAMGYTLKYSIEQSA